MMRYSAGNSIAVSLILRNFIAFIRLVGLILLFAVPLQTGPARAQQQPDSAVPTTASSLGAEDAEVIDMGVQRRKQTGAVAESSQAVSLSLGEVQKVWSDLVKPQEVPIVLAPEERRIYAIRVRTAMETMFITMDDPINDFYLADSTVFSAQYEPGRSNVLRLRALHTEADTTLHIVTRSGKFFHFYLEARGPDFTSVPNVAVYVGQPIQSGVNLSMANGPTALGDQVTLALTRQEGARQEGVSQNASVIPGPGSVSPVPDAESGQQTDGNVVPRPDWLREIPYDPGSLEFDEYSVFIEDEASREIAPVRVFHDGTYTYLDFGEKSDVIEKPTVRMVLDEIDTPITYSVIGPKDNIFAVHAVGSFTLRAAGKLVCIIFKGSLHKGTDGQIELKRMTERQAGRPTNQETNLEAEGEGQVATGRASDRDGITPFVRDGGDQ